jgi:hypothetical protein
MTVVFTEYIDFFLGLFGFTGGYSGLILRLFQASITLAGFTSVFLIFRYRRIDAYIDNQKSVLRDLVNWTHDPHVLVRIQNIGKKDKHPPDQNDKDFFGKDNEAVQRFVADILELMKKKKISVRLGVISITFWIIISLGCLVGYYCLSGYFCYATAVNAAKIAVTFFYLNLVFTYFTLIYAIEIY